MKGASARQVLKLSILASTAIVTPDRRRRRMMRLKQFPVEPDQVLLESSCGTTVMWGRPLEHHRPLQGRALLTIREDTKSPYRAC